MIAKLVVWGETRALALNSLIARLREYHVSAKIETILVHWITCSFDLLQISGLDTNVNFLIDLASHPSFQAADVHTGFIEQHIDSLFPPVEISNETISQAIAAIVTSERNASLARSAEQGHENSAWMACDGFRVNSFLQRKFSIESNGQKYEILLKYIDSNYEIKINDGEWTPFTVKTIHDQNPNRFTLKLNLNGVESIFSSVIRDNVIDVFNEVS